MTRSICLHGLQGEKHTAQKLQASNLTAWHHTPALTGTPKCFLLLDQGYCKEYWGVSHSDLLSIEIQLMNNMEKGVTPAPQ